MWMGVVFGGVRTCHCGMGVVFGVRYWVSGGHCGGCGLWSEVLGCHWGGYSANIIQSSVHNKETSILRIPSHIPTTHSLCVLPPYSGNLHIKDTFIGSTL